MTCCNYQSVRQDVYVSRGSSLPEVVHLEWKLLQVFWHPYKLWLWKLFNLKIVRLPLKAKEKTSNSTEAVHASNPAKKKRKKKDMTVLWLEIGFVLCYTTLSSFKSLLHFFCVLWCIGRTCEWNRFSGKLSAYLPMWNMNLLWLPCALISDYSLELRGQMLCGLSCPDC